MNVFVVHASAAILLRHVDLVPVCKRSVLGRAGNNKAEQCQNHAAKHSKPLAQND